jgi:hypothetical protein
VHVTLRVFTHSLRGQYVARVVLRALHRSNSSCFRVVHRSVQANHLHLLVEAEDKHALKNRHKHAASEPNKLDPLSSIQWFDGLAIATPSSFRSTSPPCAPATAWLLRIGWRRLGLLKPNEAPKSNH